MVVVDDVLDGVVVVVDDVVVDDVLVEEVVVEDVVVEDGFEPGRHWESVIE